jgi:hypothetical protein
MKNKLIACLLLVLCTKFVSAQNGRQSNFISYPTPNVASLGEFALMPPNPFNGQASVSVPLYTVNYRDLSIPMLLSYSTKGNKVEDHPSFVGLGWNFNSGGVIYRKTNGWYDEHPNEFETFNYSRELCYYYNCGKITNNYDESQSMSILSDLNYSVRPPFTYYDAMPDEFIFNFNGYSGVFYITRKSEIDSVEIKIRSNGDYKLKAEILEIREGVEFMDYMMETNNGDMPFKRTAPRAIYKIKITDPTGIDYIFGGTAESIEFSNSDGLKYSFNTLATAWHLTEVISQFGHKISFTYVKKGRVIIPRNQTRYIKYFSHQGFTSSGFGFSNSSGESNGHSGQNDMTMYTLLSPSYLEEIQTPVSRIKLSYEPADNQLKYKESNFNVSLRYFLFDETDWDRGGKYSRPYKLTEITVDKVNKGAANSIERKIKFSYIENINTRLKLKSVSFYGENTLSNPVMQYGFLYNPLPLPDYGSKKEDHWGYYNGRAYVFGPTHYATRSPDPTYSRAEMLEQVIYPTGGSLQLEYEPNRVSKGLRQFPFSVFDTLNNTIGPGLRVKSMSIKASADAAVIKKEYIYISNYLKGGQVSSGVLAGVPMYTNTAVFEGTWNLSRKGWVATINQSGTDYQWLLEEQDNNYYKMGMTNGDDVTYSEVVEKTTENGYTVYYYSNHDNGYIDKMPYVSYANFSGRLYGEGFVSLQTFRGSLLKTELYNSDKALIRSIENTFFIDTSNAQKVYYYDQVYPPEFEGGYDSGEPNLPPAIAVRTAVLAYFIKPPLIKTSVTKSYGISGEILFSEQVSYQYFIDRYPSGDILHDNYKPVQVSTQSSKNKTQVKVLKYPFDFTIQTVYNDMVARNINSVVVEETDKLDNTILKQSRNNYTHHLNTSTMHWQYDFFVPDNYEEKIGQGAMKVKYNLGYDQVGNITNVTYANGIQEVYLWRSNNPFPALKITGRDLQGVMNYYKTTLGVVQLTPDEIPADNRWLINHYSGTNTLVDIVSYTSVPDIGITSETGINGRTVYYEYDHFDRLSLIKDHEGNVVKKHSYDYTTSNPDYLTPFFNQTQYQNDAIVNASVAKNNCNVNMNSPLVYGSIELISVPAGLFSSTISKEVANLMAWEYAQEKANEQGQCVYVSLEIEDIDIVEGGDTYYYTGTPTLRAFTDPEKTIPYYGDVRVTYRIEEGGTNYLSDPVQTLEPNTIADCYGNYFYTKKLTLDMSAGSMAIANSIIYYWTRFYFIAPGDPMPECENTRWYYLSY